MQDVVFFCPFLIMMILPLLVVLVVVVVVAVASDASNVVVSPSARHRRCFSFSKTKHRRGWGSSESKVVSPQLWNTPLNLYQQTIKGFLS